MGKTTGRKATDMMAEQVAIAHASKRGTGRAARVPMDRFRAMLRRWPLGIAEWSAAIHVSPRSLTSRISKGRAFDALESERVLLVEDVMERGREVFGDEEKFRRWLDRPHPLFGGGKPKDMLDSLANIGEVMAELGRIEHGVF